MASPRRSDGRGGMAGGPSGSRVLPRVVLLAALAASCGPSDIERNEQAALDDVMLFAQANFALAMGTAGGYVAPDVLSDPEQVGPARAIPERFRQEVRNGYRFRFEGIEREYGVTRPYLIEPAFPDFSYIATPVEPGKSGIQSLGYWSYRTGAVYVRADGGEPTINDTVIEFRMTR